MQASIEATTESGLTPLHVASFMGCMNIVIYLLQQGANVDVTTVRGETPLHLAARANQTDIVRILLRNGAAVDAKARELQTPLHIASRLGNTDICMLLIQGESFRMVSYWSILQRTRMSMRPRAISTRRCILQRRKDKKRSP